ncbi:MAG: hypothetical protein ACE5MI_01415 [Acidimicrobiia bacterium]
MSDQGSVSVAAAAAVGLAVVLATGLGVAGQVLAAWSQAAAAADAAALAAAPITFLGGSPEREAARFAAANGARLQMCTCPVNTTFDPRTVEVLVTVRTVLPVLGPIALPAKGRAEFDPMGVVMD